MRRVYINRKYVYRQYRLVERDCLKWVDFILNPSLTFLCTVWLGKNNIFPWVSVSTCVKEKDWELTHWLMLMIGDNISKWP